MDKFTQVTKITIERINPDAEDIKIHRGLENSAAVFFNENDWRAVVERDYTEDYKKVARIVGEDAAYEVMRTLSE